MPNNEPNDAAAPRPTAPGRRFVFRLVRAVVVAYLVVVALMVIFENYLVYPGTRIRGGDWSPAFEYEDVSFEAADGTQLHGWYLEHPTPTAHLLLCHGNGENVAMMGDGLLFYRNYFRVSLLAFDYRGYGQSQGKPTEDGLIEDGLAAQRWLAKRAGIQPDQIVLLGRSLGGGVAVDLAATEGARALILERTFTSLPAAAARIYPWAPVRLLMRNQFDSLSKIDGYRGPLLQSHGTADEIVAFELGQQLFAASPSEPKRFMELPGLRHNAPDPPEYHAAVLKFITTLPPLSD